MIMCVTMALATDEVSVCRALEEMPAGTKSHAENNLKKMLWMNSKEFAHIGECL